MRINSTVGDLRQSLKDLVALKAGLILTEGQVIEHLNQGYDRKEAWGEPHGWWESDDERGITRRAEELQRDFLVLMHEIGAIPDRRGPVQLVIDYLQEELLPDDLDEGEKKAITIAKAPNIQLEIVRDREPPEFRPIAPEVRRRWILKQSKPEKREWNGAIALGELFKSEEVPEGTAEDRQLDQRFVDYLAADPGRLEEIHWRQFEHLCGEYFNQKGYEVEVTPPRGDGGIDVYARKDDAEVGPELVVVQAKRTTGENTVDINEVKAFWTDLDEEDATRGVVATTTRLENGARDFCEARRYRLTAAEANAVSDWLMEMTTLDDVDERRAR